MGAKRKPKQYVWVLYTEDNKPIDSVLVSSPTSVDYEWVSKGEHFVRYEVSPEPKKGTSK